MAGVQAPDAHHERRRQLLAVPLQRPLSRVLVLRWVRVRIGVSNGVESTVVAQGQAWEATELFI